MLSESSFRRSSSMCLRGWNGFVVMNSVATSCTFSPGCGRSIELGTGINASSPRPRTLRVDTVDHLLREVEIASRPLRLNVVENNRLSEARRFGKLHVAWNDRLVNLV